MGSEVASEWPPNPFVYEINTWPWLTALSEEAGRPIDLGTVPDARWDALAASGFDAVWLMGVWQRSPAGVAIALQNPALLDSFDAAVPGYSPADVVGSPYCVRGYVVDDRLGGPSGLAAARAALARCGMKLVLDFVPNHVAPDHPWTAEHPEYFVTGTRDDLQNDPASFVEVDRAVLANGKDPYFAAWPDVVQMNAFSPRLRAAVVGTLDAIADQCDAVRCDMAMLVMNETFERTWGTRAGERPAEEYWPSVIAAVRETHPEFRFIAEAYWDLEWALQQQGFDYCYDKRLYDRLVQGPAENVRQHLLAEPAYQIRLLRFIENHDEPRAAAAFDAAREKAAAVTTLTQMGARLVHHGQVEGWKTRLPVFLGRYPVEATDKDLVQFYESLLHVLSDATFRNGHWQLCDRWGWPDDDRAQHLVAWSWDGDARFLVVVNLHDAVSTGLVRAPWADVRGRSWRLVDATNDLVLERTGDDLCDGLYVELGPWRWHLFRLEPEGDQR